MQKDVSLVQPLQHFAASTGLDVMPKAGVPC